MDYLPAWSQTPEAKLNQIEELGLVVGLNRLSNNCWRVQTNFQEFIAKTGPGIEDERSGLLAIGRVENGPAVPRVLYFDSDILVTEWISHNSRTRAHEENFGRALAWLHESTTDEWGAGSSWIGACQLESANSKSGVEFYRFLARVLPPSGGR